MTKSPQGEVDEASWTQFKLSLEGLTNNIGPPHEKTVIVKRGHRDIDRY